MDFRSPEKYRKWHLAYFASPSFICSLVKCPQESQYLHTGYFRMNTILAYFQMSYTFQAFFHNFLWMVEGEGMYIDKSKFFF